jgi:hypothetical protein
MLHKMPRSSWGLSLGLVVWLGWLAAHPACALADEPPVAAALPGHFVYQSELERAARDYRRGALMGPLGLGALLSGVAFVAVGGSVVTSTQERLPPGFPEPPGYDGFQAGNRAIGTGLLTAGSVLAAAGIALLSVGVPALMRGRRDLLRHGIPLGRRVHLTPRGLIY